MCHAFRTSIWIDGFPFEVIGQRRHGRCSPCAVHVVSRVCLRLVILTTKRLDAQRLGSIARKPWRRFCGDSCRLIHLALLLLQTTCRGLSVTQRFPTLGSKQTGAQTRTSARSLGLIAGNLRRRSHDVGVVRQRGSRGRCVPGLINAQARFGGGECSRNCLIRESFAGTECRDSGRWLTRTKVVVQQQGRPAQEKVRAEDSVRCATSNQGGSRCCRGLMDGVFCRYQGRKGLVIRQRSLKYPWSALTGASRSAPDT